MKQQLIQKAHLIKGFRKRTEQNDTLEIQERRRKVLDWFSINNFNPSVEFLEMYKTPEGEVIKGKQEGQYYSKFINTRTKTLTETRAEMDKLPFDKALDVCLEIIKLLKDYHFAVFYAEGQRSPHIIIYDFDELKTELKTKRERYLAQIEFWKGVCPFFLQHLDFSIFHDDHLLPLEFSIHYRTGTPFNLIMEWIPEKKQEVKRIVINKPKEKKKTIESKKERCPGCNKRDLFLFYEVKSYKLFQCAGCGFTKKEDIICKD